MQPNTWTDYVFAQKRAIKNGYVLNTVETNELNKIQPDSGKVYELKDKSKGILNGNGEIYDTIILLNPRVVKNWV